MAEIEDEIQNPQKTFDSFKIEGDILKLIKKIRKRDYKGEIKESEEKMEFPLEEKKINKYGIFKGDWKSFESSKASSKKGDSFVLLLKKDGKWKAKKARTPLETAPHVEDHTENFRDQTTVRKNKKLHIYREILDEYDEVIVLKQYYNTGAKDDREKGIADWNIARGGKAFKLIEED